MQTNIASFKQLPIEVRKKKAESERNGHPDKIPILIESSPGELGLLFCLPGSVKVLSLIQHLRKIFKTSETMAMYIYSKNKVLNPDCLVGKCYQDCKSEDGFLYLSRKEMEAIG